MEILGISPDQLGISIFTMLGMEDFTQKDGIFKHGEDNGCESLVQTTGDSLRKPGLSSLVATIHLSDFSGSLILRNTCITYPGKERCVPSPEKLVDSFDGISLPHLSQPRFQVNI